MRVVIPAAGLGRRFEPLSRVVPKELLLLGDRPLLHHALDEASSAGFESAVVVVSPPKELLIRRYCEEAALPLPVEFAIQPSMDGLGDAVLRANIEAPFGVLLPDDVVRDGSHWDLLRSVHARTGGGALCVRPVPLAEAGRFGIAECLAVGELLRVTRLVEKPRPGETRSDLAIFGRYIVTEAVLRALRVLKIEGELQLTDGFAVAAAADPGVYAVRYEGEILDCGTPQSYARASAIHWRQEGSGREEEGRLLNQQLVNQLRVAGMIQSQEVAEAFESVPRHHFLPQVGLLEVYRDEAIPIKLEEGIAISSSSQPAMMAIMLEQLGAAPGHRVLEIGAGSGYNAALLKRLVGPAGSVVSLDFDADLIEAAGRHLDRAGVEGVELLHGDGATGHPAGAPYDRIILTVAATDIAPAWLEQLKPDGLLLLPLTLVAGVQKSVALQRRGDRWESVSLRNCGFMPLRGALADESRQLRLGDGLGLAIERVRPVRAARVAGWLRSPARSTETGMTVSLEQSWGGLRFSLALGEADFAGLNVQKPPATLDDPPVLISHGRPGATQFLGSCGLLRDRGLALLHRDPTSGRLSIRAYGDGAEAASDLQAALASWDQAGRPDSDRIRISALPVGSPVVPGPGDIAIVRTHSRLVISRL